MQIRLNSSKKDSLIKSAVKAIDESNKTDGSLIGCPLSKGNQVINPKFERPNGKNTKSNFFFEIGPELVCPAHLKAQ